MTEALTTGGVSSTVALKLVVAVLVALSMGLTVYVRAPSASTASAVSSVLRQV